LSLQKGKYKKWQDREKVKKLWHLWLKGQLNIVNIEHYDIMEDVIMAR